MTVEFTLDDEQTMLADAVARWLEADYTMEVRRRLVAGTESSDVNWQQLAALGLLGLHVSEAHGGMGASPIEALLVMQAFGRALVVEPYIQNAVEAATLLARAASDAQQAQWLPALAAGERRVVLATREPGTGCDLAEIALRAETRGSGFVLHGRKVLVIGGDSADAFIVPARTRGARGDEDGISLFLVPRTVAGVEISGYHTIDGMRAADLGFSDVAIDAQALVGVLHDGHGEIELAVDRGIAALCAEAVGAMERLIELTAEHLRTRRQFGQPIGAFQALQHQLADMAIATEQARSMALLAAAQADGADRARRRAAVSAAKVTIGQSGRSVGELAIQLHGGMGMTDETATGWYVKRLLAIDLTHGDTDHHLELYGAML